MSESDFKDYCVLVCEELKKHGIHTNPDYDPTYKYFIALNKAEDELIDWGYSILRKQPQWRIFGKELEEMRNKLDCHTKYKERVIDLTLKVTA